MSQTPNGERAVVCIVGPFPPPVHGMAVANQWLVDQLRMRNRPYLTINTATKDLDRRLFRRLMRLPRVTEGLLRWAVRAWWKRIPTLYVSVSGGWGQVYDLAYVLIARLTRCRIVLHHHSFAYLAGRRRLSVLLFRVAGTRAEHVVLCDAHGARLRAVYPSVSRVQCLENSVITVSKVPGVPRSRLKTLGFLSNVSVEKGILDFLDVLRRLRHRGEDVEGVVVGPFDDAVVASRVQRELEGLPHVTYRGAAYGAEKDAAYASMDALLFPTRYVNEAAPIVVYEALARGIPVIANRRGCVPDMLRAGGGVLQDEGSFVAGAVEQVVSWIHDPWSFRHASECALQGAAAAAAEEPTTTDRYVDWLTATGRPGSHGRTW